MKVQNMSPFFQGDHSLCPYEAQEKLDTELSNDEVRARNF